jgi:hypothetical protein
MLTAVRQNVGHYEVQEVDFGRVYRWCPGHIDTDCECGERLNLTACSNTICPRCGTNRAATIREESTAEWSEDQALHPWRYDARNLDDAGLPC